MKFILIAILSVILQLFTPWWVIAIVPFVILLWQPSRTGEAFWVGFGGIAVPWLIYGYYQHFISDGAMSDRVAKIFMLPNGILLLVITAVISGLIGGFSGLTGRWIREIFRQNPLPLSGRTS